MDLSLVALLCLALGGNQEECVQNTQKLKQTEPPEPIDEGPLRVCYYTTWARYRPKPANMQPSDVDGSLCSHLIIAFAWISEGGARLSFQSEWEDTKLFNELVALKIKHPKLKVLAAVGGWNFGSEPFRRVLRTQDNMITFVESTMDFLRRHNLDGLDLDWEYPDQDDKVKFTELMRMLHEAFVKHSTKTGGPKYLLTAAIAAAERNTHGYDVPVVKHYLDFVNLMTYDLHGPWDKKTGHNAPLFSSDKLNLNDATRLWEDLGMPKKKIVIGIASYGHSFELADKSKPILNAPIIQGVPGPYTRTDGFFSYYEVCNFLKEEGTVLQWDDKALVPYAYNIGPNGNDTWVSFDNALSVRHKVKWTLDHGLGGVMLWSLAMDDFAGRFCDGNITYPILRAMNEGLGVYQSEITKPQVDSIADEKKNTNLGTAEKMIRNIEMLSAMQKAGTLNLPRVSAITDITDEPNDELLHESRSISNPHPESALPHLPGLELEIPAWVFEEPKTTKSVRRTQSTSTPKKVTMLRSSNVEVRTDWDEGNECDFSSEPRRQDCTHFVRCNAGILHHFSCPPGTVFSSDSRRCDWPFEVPECKDQVEKIPPKTRKPDFSPQLRQAHSTPNLRHFKWSTTPPPQSKQITAGSVVSYDTNFNTNYNSHLPILSPGQTSFAQLFQKLFEAKR